jgi:hypothetical protein
MMKKETLTPNPTINNLHYLKIPGTLAKYEIFWLQNDLLPNGYRSCAIVDYALKVPLISVNSFPIDRIKDLYAVLIHFYKAEKGEMAQPILQLSLRALEDNYVFYIKNWYQRHVVSGDLVNDGTVNRCIAINYKHGNLTDYQKNVQNIAFCLNSNQDKPLIHIGNPGLPLKVIKQMIEAINNNPSKIQ